MPKIVVLGSLRFEPYEILYVPRRLHKTVNQTDQEYREAVKIVYPKIDKADEVWVYIPDGLGEHTQRDLEYAISQGKKILFITGEE